MTLTESIRGHAGRYGLVRVTFVLATLCALGACKEDTPEPPPPTEGSATVGAQGGTVPGPDGSSIVVPAGALGADTTLRIARDTAGAPPLPADTTPVSSVYTFTPHGVAFQDRVSITLPFDSSAVPSGGTPQFMLAENGGPWVQLSDSLVQGNSITAPVMGFSYGRVAVDGTAGPPRLTMSMIAPTNLPTVSSGSSLRLVNQPLNVTIRASINPNFVIATRNYSCLDIPTLELRRAITTAPPGAPITMSPPRSPATYPLVESRQTAVGADFVVPLDHTHNGMVYFVVAIDCNLRIPPNTVIDAALAPPYYAGYVWLRVDIPTPVGAPTITQQPQNITVVEGNRAEFHIAATAPDSLTLQWQSSTDGGVTWATVQSGGDSLAFSPAQLADDGTLVRVGVCNALGVRLNCLNSNVATLNVVAAMTPPQFSQQPTDMTVVAGQTASFSVVATGTPAPTVQWYRATTSGGAGAVVGTPCAGSGTATPCTYLTGALSSGDSESEYYAVAQNSSGSVDSLRATLLVQATAAPPTIPSGEPEDVFVSEGATATFSVNASGTAPLSYQWRRDGVDIVGANASAYSLPMVQLSDDGAIFSVIVSNSEGSVPSRNARLNVSALEGGCTGASSSSWCFISPLPTSNDLRAVAFDGNRVLAVGWRTNVASADGAMPWQASVGASNEDWRDVASPSSGVFVGAARAGVDPGIYVSNNAGQTWMQTMSGDANALAFADANQGVAMSDSIYRSTDGGQHWASLGLVPGFNAGMINRIVSPAANTYVAVGDYGKILRSTDSGANWTVINAGSSLENHWTGLAFGNANVGIVSSGGATLKRTTDGGVTWNDVASPVFNSIAAIAFADPSHAVLIDAGGQVATSDDAGATWSLGTSLFGAEDVTNLRFKNATTGYATAKFGQIWYTDDAGANWTLMAGGSDLQDLHTVRFSSVGVGLIAGGESLRRSVDGGNTWVDTLPRYAFGVAFASDSVAVAATRNGEIYRSTDAGINWSSVYNDPTVVFDAVDFATASVGVAVGPGGRVLRTTDGGQTWNAVASGTGEELFCVRFASATVGYACGVNTTLLRTTDAGATWGPVAVVPANPNDFINDVAMPSSGVLVLATESGVLRSTDNGSTWALVSNPSRGSVLGIDFADANIGIAVGAVGMIQRTTDGGATWTDLDLPLTPYLLGVTFYDANTVYAVGEGHTILRNLQGGQP